MVLLHGMFGAGGNLGALARSLQADYRVFALDMPGHGRSPWLDSYSLSTLADAVSAWLDTETIDPVTIVGHSLGGKIAMQLALSQPARVRSLVVADIAPVHYSGRQDAVLTALAAVSEAAVSSRDEAAALMREHLEEEGVIQFLLASLHRDGDAYGWRMDVEGLTRDYMALAEAPCGDAAWPGPVLFVKGSESNYIRSSHREAIASLFPSAQLKVMSGCGHWLHAEKPQLFNGIVGRFLAETVGQPGDAGQREFSR